MRKLRELVTIMTGVMTKSHSKSVPGGVRVVQMKDLDIHKEINVDQLATIELKSFPGFASLAGRRYLVSFAWHNQYFGLFPRRCRGDSGGSYVATASHWRHSNTRIHKLVY